MTMDEARELLAYGSWANARMFAATEGLTSEQSDAELISSFPSVRATLGHIVAAEWVWLRRWLGESPTEMPLWVGEASRKELHDTLAAVEAERTRFLEGLSDADLDQVVAYRTLAGEAHADALGDLLRHVVNHSTYHRGQLATQLRQLGRTPPGTDLIIWLRKQRPA